MAGGDVRARRGPVLWPLLTLAPIGLGAPAIVYAGVRARRPWWILLGLLWCAVFVARFVVDASEGEDSNNAGGLFIIAWVGAVATGFTLRPAYRRALDELEDHPFAGARTRLARRRRAARLAREHPELALEAGVGRPDLPGAVDGGLIDVNNASISPLERLPGVDRALARRIATARAEVDGFSSLEDLGASLDLDGSLVEDLRGRAVFLPR